MPEILSRNSGDSPLTPTNQPEEFYGMLRAGLSIREAQVLLGLLAGQEQKVIAIDLGLSAKTIHTYKRTAMEKLNVANDVALILRSIELGFIETPCRNKAA